MGPWSIGCLYRPLRCVYFGRGGVDGDWMWPPNDKNVLVWGGAVRCCGVVGGCGSGGVLRGRRRALCLRQGAEAVSASAEPIETPVV